MRDEQLQSGKIFQNIIAKTQGANECKRIQMLNFFFFPSRNTGAELFTGLTSNFFFFLLDWITGPRENFQCEDQVSIPGQNCETRVPCH